VSGILGLGQFFVKKNGGRFVDLSVQPLYQPIHALHQFDLYD